jgi:SAM-dependent methyltransferase
MTTTHWANRSRIWSRSGPPLRPNQEIMDCFTSLVSVDQHILLLGVTKEIATAYNNITAVEREPAMIENVWVGNSETKRAILDNWLTVPFSDNTFDAILGDGSLNMLSEPGQVVEFVNRAMPWLKPGGQLICRMFTRPDTPITMTRIHAEAKTPTVNFSALRRLIPMYIAEQNGPRVPVRLISNLFDQMFPDRTILPWTPEEMTTLDAYYTSEAKTWFPTRQEILEELPKDVTARFLDVGTYDIADTCPMLIITR